MEVRKLDASQVPEMTQPPAEKKLARLQVSQLGILDVKDEIVSAGKLEGLEADLLFGRTDDSVIGESIMGQAHDPSEIAQIPGGLDLGGLDMPPEGVGGLSGQSHESLNPQNPERPDVRTGIGPGHVKVDTPIQPGPGDPSAAGWWDAGTGVPGPIDPTASAPVHTEPAPAPVKPHGMVVLENVTTMAAFPDVDGGTPPKPTMGISDGATRQTRNPPNPPPKS